MEILVSEMKRRMRNKSQMREDEPMIGNPADEISQSEKRRILAEDRKARSTYFQHAQSVIDEDRGGRFSAAGSSPKVVGASSISYPAQPEGSPWRSDPVPAEMPLGYSVDEQEPVGELHERTASTTAASAVEDGASKKFRRRI
jgi:hypothetical protein